MTETIVFKWDFCQNLMLAWTQISFRVGSALTFEFDENDINLLTR